MNDTLVIYHSADLDGICSREIARRALPGATLLGWDYGQPIPDLSSYRTVYLIDVSFPPEVMKANAEKLVWIDHHRTAINDNAGTDIPGYRIDGVAACRLAWQWFMLQWDAEAPLPTKEDYVARRVSEPYAVQLLGEYDVWDKRNPQTDAFQLGMQAESAPEWDRLFRVTPEMVHNLERSGDTGLVKLILERGRAIQSYLDVTNAQISKERGFDVQWEGLLFRALNTARCNSLTFTAALRPEHDGCLGYFWDGGKWRFSLYGVPHKPDVDLSVIAKRYGGGGHKQACGGTFKDGLPPELGGPKPITIYQLNPVHPKPEKLPETLLTGRRIRVKEGHTWAGWTGTVTSHYISGDDCGPRWGKQEVAVERPDGERFSVSPDDCEILS